VAALKDYDVQAWTGTFAPATTPRPILERLHREIGEIVQSPEVQQRLINQNLEAFPSMSQLQWAAYMNAEFTKWQQVAREGKIAAPQ
jgi:tripartite-type tricarboxylate transporter receptor subunit TctC